MNKYPILKGIFRKLTESEWFRRAWCSHELMMGTEHVCFIPCERRRTVFRISGRFLLDLCFLASELKESNIDPSGFNGALFEAVLVAVTASPRTNHLVDIFSNVARLHAS